MYSLSEEKGVWTVRGKGMYRLSEETGCIVYQKKWDL